MKIAYWGLAAGLLGLAGCDSTPRERQEIVRQETRQLDTAAAHAGQTLRRLGRQTARFDSANHARRAVPLDPKKQKEWTSNCWGLRRPGAGPHRWPPSRGPTASCCAPPACAAPAGRPATGTTPRPPTAA
ncbi:MAG: hypothetical protein WKG07_23040 [Hymenobacter sp.]